MDRKNHWENVYNKKKIDEVSWYQAHPELSLCMIKAAKLSLDDPIIDVGGGASKLVDHLVGLGFQNLTVLDISEKALEKAKQRLSNKGTNIQWIASDILEFNPKISYLFWHDRAVFHFLTDLKERWQYLETMKRTLSHSAYAMIATFALSGPEKCSGMPVQRYSDESLEQTLGSDYRLLMREEETHTTPAGKQQSFIYGLFKRE